MCSLGLSRELADQINFSLTVNCPVFAEDIMEPRVWFFVVRFLPGIPGIDRLTATVHEPPVVGTDVELFEGWHDALESGVVAAGHVFCAHHRAPLPELHQALRQFTCAFRAIVSVKRNNVRFIKAQLVKRCGIVQVIAPPNPTRDRLRRSDLACPGKCLAQQFG